MLVSEDKSRALLENHIKHEAKWDSLEKLTSVIDLVDKMKNSTALLETTEAYDKVVLFIGHGDIKNGEKAQRVFTSLKHLATKILSVGTDVAITVLPPVNEVNKNCHLMILNRHLQNINADLGIQVISIDYFKETPMYDILDMDGHITAETAKKVAMEIVNKLVIRAVEKKDLSDDKENNAPEGQPEPKPVPKKTLDECVPVPFPYIGRLIGKRGSTIREIQVKSGARVSIETVDITGTPEEAACLYGTPTQMRLAKQMVVDVLVRCEKNG